MSEYDPQNQYPEQSGLYRSGSTYSLPCNGPPTPQFSPLYGAPDFSTWQTAAAAYVSPSSNIRSYYPSAANFISPTGGRFSPTLLAHQAATQNGHFYSFPDVTGNPMSGIHNGQHLSNIPFTNYSAASSFRGAGLGSDPSRTLKLGFTETQEKSKKTHIKKPLNAFMLFMKEMRAKVVAECTLKESAAINQILGRKWHALSREDQAKYYEMARKEKELHHQLYPGWSARDNYASNVKRKKKRSSSSGNGSNSKLLSNSADSQAYSLMKKDKSYMMPSAQWFKQAWTGKSSPSFSVNPNYFDGIQSRSLLGSGDALTNMSQNSNSSVASMISPISGTSLGMLPPTGNINTDLDPYGFQYGAAALHNSLRQHQSIYGSSLPVMDAAISQAIKLEKFEGIISNSFMTNTSSCEERTVDGGASVAVTSANNSLSSHTIMDLS